MFQRQGINQPTVHGEEYQKLEQTWPVQHWTPFSDDLFQLSRKIRRLNDGENEASVHTIVRLFLHEDFRRRNRSPPYFRERRKNRHSFLVRLYIFFLCTYDNCGRVVVIGPLFWNGQFHEIGTLFAIPDRIVPSKISEI